MSKSSISIGSPAEPVGNLALILLLALRFGSLGVGVRAAFFLPLSRVTDAESFLFVVADGGFPFCVPLAVTGATPGAVLPAMLSSWVLMVGCVGLGSPVRGSMYGSDASNLMVLVCGCDVSVVDKGMLGVEGTEAVTLIGFSIGATGGT